jgi:hypothetical protein
MSFGFNFGKNLFGISSIFLFSVTWGRDSTIGDGKLNFGHKMGIELPALEMPLRAWLQSTKHECVKISSTN